MVMKALSLKQPWAGLVLAGTKTIETRKWSTKHRGPLLICACAKGKSVPGERDLPGERIFGMALCIVDVVHCRPMREEDWGAAVCEPYPNAWAWELENVRAIEPFAVKGQLGLFNVADELILFSIGGGK